MAELYGFTLPINSLFKKELIGDYVDLDKFTVHQFGRHANNHIEGTEAYKLFFDYFDEGEEDEAQVFLNINLVGHRIEIREKDVEYRKPLLALLSAGKP
ncbi:hypothetical protein [Mucilaginibacter myungsuensis]|uniref:Uncharacterized protein n=1 Tax=Mucilaginibacter myungsuensis TaxID=649104 RepID=A0A929PVY7_9SPHI|nr:hypothetical protein [Mucilaginibacter myungsuensis]MBE9660592.1 hypothetical protein [Mucilaginibacter myungsuensis]MDN3600636.1 hypothetical protein [Mucilaginibacter myungsuensis]